MARISFKPSRDERINKAKEIFNNSISHKSIGDILELVKEGLKSVGIVGYPQIINPDEVFGNYDNIRKEHKTNDSGHIIFIQFADSGHIVVVGAGKDASFTTNEKYLNAAILSKLKIGWNCEQMIVIPVRGLDPNSVGYKNVKNVLECRNGVETYIGNYLESKGVPILNYYQHKNYKEDVWKEWEKNKYDI